MKMGKLLTAQCEFSVCLAELTNYATMRGYGLTQGDAMRDKRVFGEFGVKKGYSHSKSTHKLRLAHDYNLIVDGEYIADGDHPAWIDIGEQWEKMHNLARWGGRFNDANHFSFEWYGMK